MTQPPKIEPLGGDTVYDGSQFTVRVERFRHADGEEVEREIVRRMDAAAIVAYDDEHVWLVRQPREALLDYTLELPAGKLDVEGESPLQTAQRELAEEIGREADDWQEVRAYHASSGYTDELVHVFAATAAASVRRRGRSRRADRDRALAAGRSRRRAGRDDGRQDGHRAAVAARDARVIVRLITHAALHRNGPRRGRRNPTAWPSLTPTPPSPVPSSTTCSTSSRISSSSAACRATRWRPTAPTCCSSARSSLRDELDATTVGHAELARFLSELTAGGPQRPPVAPATIQRKTACLRSFYRHLRREEIIAHDPTAELRAPRKRQKLPQVLSRDEVAKLLAAPRGDEARGAARPRDARAHVRLRAARERGRRPHGRQRRPALRRRAGARQGLQGAAHPGRPPGDPRRPHLPRARAPEARRPARGAPPVRQPPRHRAHAPGPATRSSSATRRAPASPGA